MKRVALLSCFFPPDGGAGAQRPRRMAELAHTFGWEITVITRALPSERSLWEPQDASIQAGKQAIIERVETPENSQVTTNTPAVDADRDPFLKAVVDRAAALHAERPFDAVVVTMPPYGMAPSALMAKERLGVPVFVDLQDPWALDGAFAYSNKAQWAINNDWMHRVMTGCDGVIMNTPEARAQVHKAIPSLPGDRLTNVNNGCTFADFEGPMPPRPEEMKPDSFYLVHTGTLHTAAWARTRGLVGWLRQKRNHRAEPAKIGGRTAHYLLQAIAQLDRNNDPRLKDFRLALVGVKDPAIHGMIEKSGVADRVDVIGFVPYETSLAWIRHANALFVPLFGLPKGHRSRLVPSKTYEYLASGRPVLGALPEGDARDLVERSAVGRCADPCDAVALAEALGQVIDLAKAHRGDPPRPEGWAREYDWPQLCERFFSTLHDWTGGQPTSEG